MAFCKSEEFTIARVGNSFCNFVLFHYAINRALKKDPAVFYTDGPISLVFISPPHLRRPNTPTFLQNRRVFGDGFISSGEMVGQSDKFTRPPDFKKACLPRNRH